MDRITKHGPGRLEQTGPNEYRGIFSDPKPDRVGDVILDWRWLTESVPLTLDHDDARVVGKAFPEVDDRRLVGRVVLAPCGESEDAGRARELAAKGAGLSIDAGWLRRERNEHGGWTYPAVLLTGLTITDKRTPCCESCRIQAPIPLAKAAPTWDPMESVRDYCAEKREELAAATRFHGGLSPAPSFAEFLGADGEETEEWAKRRRSWKRYAMVTKAFS